MAEKKRAPSKPHGRTGPISFGPNGITRHLLLFPSNKEEREKDLAEMFVKSIETNESDTLKPFRNLVQNAENDLDFTVDTEEGTKLLELAEFAPLAELRTSYAQAPRHFVTGDITKLFLMLIVNKSKHQGGTNRVLVTYPTHDAFSLSPLAVELARRYLNVHPPAFDRVYILTPCDPTGGTVEEVYPGRPHSFFTDWSDAKLANYPSPRVDFDELASAKPTDADHKPPRV